MVALCAIVVYCAAPGMTYGISALVPDLTSDLDVSRGVFTTSYGVATIIAASFLMVLGKIFDRLGGRVLMVVAIVGLAIGLAWQSFAQGTTWLFLGFILLRAFGQGLMPLAARVVVPHWFYRHRARAYSVLGLATTVSLATVPPIHAFLLDRLDWRVLWRIEAVLLAGILAPLVWWFVRDRPEDVGQHADGASSSPSLPGEGAHGSGISLGIALRTFPFWALVLAGTMPMSIVTGLSLDQAGIYADRGFPASLATTTFTIESIAMFGCTFALGATLDRMPLRVPMIAGQVLLVAGMLLLLLTDALWTGVLYALLRGAGTGTVMLAADVAYVAWFGRRYLGSIRGFAAAFGVFGSALGPIPFGLAFDHWGTYGGAIAGMMVVPVICAVLMLLARPPRRAGETPVLIAS
jgi:MFS family permease